MKKQSKAILILEKIYREITVQIDGKPVASLDPFEAWKVMKEWNALQLKYLKSWQYDDNRNLNLLEDDDF